MAALDDPARLAAFKEWLDHKFHYDLRFDVDGRPVYAETRLYFSDPLDPDDPWIHVVSFHDP